MMEVGQTHWVDADFEVADEGNVDEDNVDQHRS